MTGKLSGYVSGQLTSNKKDCWLPSSPYYGTYYACKISFIDKKEYKLLIVNITVTPFYKMALKLNMKSSKRLIYITET